jgi:uncharacterized protein (TIGR00255 family)
MTGFGRSESELDGRKMTIEIRTVNHRFLDINIRIPRTLGFAEEHMRKVIKDRLSRGRVDVFVNYTTAGAEARTAEADIGLIQSFVTAARSAATAVGLPDDLQLSHIIRIPDAITVTEAQEDETRQLALIDSVLTDALNALTAMRSREGAALKTDLTALLGDLGVIVSTIDERKEYVTKDYSEKLKTRLTELLEDDSDIDESRFNAEIAYIADKADINEEIVRLGTHINQFSAAVDGCAAVGRKLDFMVQEMNRELNTIGSKSQDIGITNAVIEGKSIVERIREQVQNIE